MADSYTPGPWEVRDDGEEESNAVSICAPWSGEVRAGFAPGFGDYRGVHVARLSWPPDDGHSEPTVRANARLIAAVHDLFAVAEELATAGVVYQDPLVGHMEIQVAANAIERARAAIRKATGA